MALKTDAEQVRDLCGKIIQAELKRAEILATNGVIFLDDAGDISVTLTPAQKQAALAVEAGWITTIKTITGAW